jgi:cysteine desulfurase / selenocysteine lyase
MDRRSFLRMSLATPLAAKILTTENAIATGPANTPIALDESYWSGIRAQFPISQGELLYMNNGTMGPSPRAVTERVTNRIAHVDRTGDYGGNYEEIKKAVARVIGAPSHDDIAFTHNVSEAISIIASGVKLAAGDEVILTDQEHGGNAIPWLARAKKDGIVVKFVKLVPDDAAVLGNFFDAVTSRTKVICVPHVTCTTGQVLPIAEISALARRNGIWMVADGAHPPGMMNVNVEHLGVHAYASCGHKWLCGPKGIGFLYVAPEMREFVDPTWTGAEADKVWEYSGKLEWLPSASRYDFATQNFALYDGLLGAIEFMESIGFNNIEQRLQALTMHLRTRMREEWGETFDILTPATSITGLTTIKLRTKPYLEFSSDMLAKHKVRTRVVAESGLDANRFSCHIYTSPEDIEKFIAAGRDVLRA